MGSVKHNKRRCVFQCAIKGHGGVTTQRLIDPADQVISEVAASLLVIMNRLSCKVLSLKLKLLRSKDSFQHIRNGSLIIVVCRFQNPH